MIPDERMLPTPEVLKALGIKSDDTLRKMVRTDDFPKPYEVIKGKHHYAHSEVMAWLQRRMAAQRGVAA